jgi:hypothetical protein
MCRYSILCCVPFGWDVGGHCSGCAVTVFCAVYRLSGMLVVIVVDVQLQYFVLCTVSVHLSCSHFQSAVHCFDMIKQNGCFS